MSCKLLLFVAGDTELSRRAITNFKQVCDEMLAHPCLNEVVDVLQAPGAALQHRIIATPVTVRADTSPPLKALGDISDRKRFIAALNLRAKS